MGGLFPVNVLEFGWSNFAAKPPTPDRRIARPVFEPGTSATQVEGITTMPVRSSDFTLLVVSQRDLIKASTMTDNFSPGGYITRHITISLVQQSNEGQGRLILEVTRSHIMTHHSQ